MSVVVQGYSTSQMTAGRGWISGQFTSVCLLFCLWGCQRSVFGGLPPPFKGAQKTEQMITLNSITAAGLHDRRQKIVSRGHLVYRQKATTDARAHAHELGPMQSEQCDHRDMCKLMS